MATTSFVPKLWDARLIANLDKTLVYANLCNRDYEGEIRSAGDTVHINKLNALTVKDYTGTVTSEELGGTSLDLVIDQQKYFSFKVDDILKVQSNLALVDSAMQQAAYALSDKADQTIAGLYAQAGTQIGSNESATKIGTTNKAYDALIDMGVALTENNVPTSGRFVVVPAWFEGLLRKDDRMVSTGDAAAQAARINGYLGRVAGFDVYVSNNVPNTEGTLYKIIAGNNTAMSYAQQILNTESFRDQTSFADIVRGLMVYGVKVVQPQALVCMTANKG